MNRLVSEMMGLLLSVISKNLQSPGFDLLTVVWRKGHFVLLIDETDHAFLWFGTEGRRIALLFLYKMYGILTT